jgi:ElaB/YqjD/DUF883 family membrane-anchored ribosome-binding protein
MENEPEVIRQQMEETRASLTEKLETLEQQVVETVQGATTAVTETVENVKEAVQETVETVKDSVHGTVESVKTTLDVRRQVDQHPWLMVGGSVAVGFVAGRLLDRFQHQGPQYAPMPEIAHPHPQAAWSAPRTDDWTGPPAHAEMEPRRPTPPPAEEPSQPSQISMLAQRFSPEIDTIKGLALGTLLGVVRDLVVRYVPEKLGPQVGEVVDSITTKLGGRPISGSVLEGNFEEMIFGKGEDHARGYEPEMGRPMGSAQGSSQATVGATDRR